MTEVIVELTAATAADADRIGPKAANLAALARAGLPTPGGFCLSAHTYRAQIAALVEIAVLETRPVGEHPATL